MDTFQKVQVLGQAAQYDICAACGTEAGRIRDDIGRWIYPAAMPDGRRVMLLKILMSNACENNCLYCANRRGRDFRRISFQPEELARLFDELHRRGLVQGLFLSSAVCGGATRMMEQMLAAAELLRLKYEFRGYIHLKILPGADLACVERAAELADRLSINLEAPSQERLARIASGKDFNELLTPMGLVKAIIDRGLVTNLLPLKGKNGWKPMWEKVRQVRAGQTTQFVVGAADETDREVMRTTHWLYRELDLARAYFSAFQPVVDTPLEDRPPTPLIREHRLYQADFLFRRYGFEFDDLVFDEDGNLPRSFDPKMMWALTHPELFPVEVNLASREELLRVPGIGPRSAARILKLRRQGRFRSLQDLSKIGAVAKRAAPFILLDGRQPPIQLGLWDAPSR